MPFCGKCGKPVNATAKYCGSCGNPVQPIVQANQSVKDATFQQTVNQTPKRKTCLRCGEELEPDGEYCSYCGYPVKRKTRESSANNSSAANQSSQSQKQQTSSNNQSQNTVPPQIRTKEECIAELDSMIAYFSKVQILYDEYDECLRTKRKKAYEARRNLNRDEDFFEIIDDLLVKKDPLTIGSFFFTITFLLQFAIVFILLLMSKPGSILISIGCFLISGFTCYGGVRFMIKDNIKTQVESAKLNYQIDSLRADLTYFYNCYGYCIVDLDDTNPKTLYKIRNYLASGKADSLDKAVRMARRGRIWRW